MQKIVTSDGTYIDTMKDAYHKNNVVGCDWKEYIGKSINRGQYFITESKGYQWLQKTNR